MSEVGGINQKNWEDLVRYHDRLVKRWRRAGIVHRKPVYGDWVVLR